MPPFLKICLFTVLTSSCLFGQKAAVSSHFKFGEHITGDLSVCEVRVPTGGIAFPTYYETLGFSGNKGNSTGNGYAGIQKSDDRRGTDVHIFSIWHALNDPEDTENFPYPVHLGHGTKAEHFGGEGVGLKTWNFDLKWEADVWHTHLIRTWDVGRDTHYGFFIRNGASGKWLHLSTIGVKEPSLRIRGPNDSFIEDWKNTGEHMREMHLRNIWRRDLKGRWHPAQSGSYSPNSWDLAPGKRSHHYKNNWDAGIRKDQSGSYYFMRSGGRDTKPTPPLSYPDKMQHTFTLRNTGANPPYPSVKIEGLEGKQEGKQLSVQWKILESAVPQFSYQIEVFDNALCTGKPLHQVSAIAPEARSATIELESPQETPLHLRLKIVDLFDQPSPEVVRRVSS